MRASHPPEPPSAPPPNTPLGPLTLLERIAVGGMAEVFRAREPRAAGEPRTVVVKRMLPHIAAERGSARMFEAEARIGRLIMHPNVVAVLGSGEADGHPYLCLEHVPGLDLARLRRWMTGRGASFDVDSAIHITLELLAGLSAVHRAADETGRPLALVHGDVSPSNVLLSIHGEIKLADFGVAHAQLRSSFPQAAAAGSTRGKLAYLAPEQVRGEAHDHRADLFAAAAITGELLAGAPLFARESDLSTLLAVRDARLDVLARVRERLPPGLFQIVQRALAVDPEERFASATGLASALRVLMRQPGSIVRAAIGATVSHASNLLSTDPQPAPDEERTLEPPLTDYRIRKQSGTELGPWTFAQLVEAVTLGRLKREDEVRAEGGRWQSIADLDGLAAHLPPARLGVGRRSDTPSAIVDLAGGGLVTMLAGAVAERVNGVCVCSRADARKEIYFVDGRPEFVTSNVTGELLGEFLVSRGALSRGELDMALAVLPRFDGRLGDTLAALGLMEPVHLFRYIGEQVREKLLTLFCWPDGEARFAEGVSPPQRGFPLGIDPWRLLLDGIERRISQGLERETFMPHMTDQLVKSGKPAPAGTPGEVQRVLALVARPHPIRSVLASMTDPSEQDVHRPYRAVRLALALDLVRWSRS